MSYRRKGFRYRDSRRRRARQKRRIRGLQTALRQARAELYLVRKARYMGPLSQNLVGVFVDYRKGRVVVVPPARGERRR